MKRLVIIPVFLTLSFFCFAQRMLPTVMTPDGIKSYNPFVIEPFPYLERPNYKLLGYSDSTKLFVSDMAVSNMQCLNIAEAEVRAVLKNGRVNLGKSYLAYSDKLYCLEDDTKKLRMDVTPRGDVLLIVSICKLDKKQKCACK